MSQVNESWIFFGNLFAQLEIQVEDESRFIQANETIYVTFWKICIKSPIEVSISCKLPLKFLNATKFTWKFWLITMQIVQTEEAKLGIPHHVLLQ